MAVNDMKVMDAGMGFGWLQLDGPNTEVYPLGCHDFGDLGESLGGITRRYCPDPAAPGKWRVASVTQGPPEGVTISVTTYIAQVRDWLQRARNKCLAGLHIHLSECGRKDVFSNYDVGYLIYNPRYTAKTRKGLGMRDTRDSSEQTYEIEGDPPVSEYYKLVLTELVNTETNTINDIAACGEDLCAGECGPAEYPCDTLVAVCDAGAGVTANVLLSTNEGATWAATAADPFAADEHISSVVCFQVNRGVTRILCSRGVTDAGNPAEVAYSDDSGATWTNANVGATNGEFVQWNGGLWANDERHIWCVTNLGNIFFSSDSGATWAEETTLNASALNYVHFANDYHGITVGATNAVLSTVDGGDHWTTETGPAAQAAVNALCGWAHNKNRWFVGYADGELWFTEDGATNWTQRVLPGPNGAVSVDAINDMYWYNEFHGILVVDWTGAAAAHRASIYRTVTGGTYWEIYDVPDAFDAADTLQAGIMCNDENTFYTAGGEISAVATIYTGQASP